MPLSRVFYIHVIYTSQQLRVKGLQSEAVMGTDLPKVDKPKSLFFQLCSFRESVPMIASDYCS